MAIMSTCPDISHCAKYLSYCDDKLC